MQGAEILTKFTADTSGVDKATKNLTGSFGKLTSAFTLGSLAAKGISKTISVMNANMGDAIKRADTMNNFPKVMSNLGIGANEADKAIKTLSEKLQGLPTALDTAASAVQRLTSKNGDIKKSTDLFLAMNNAVLAGGASSELQKQALEQMSQAYAKGKPDMMEWRSMLNAMPAQLSQVAKAMGYVDSAMLGEAVRADGGEKEFARMMDTFMKMNTEGVNGFKSFEEQARNSTGGIQTSITNMKTAIVRGLTNMLNSLNASLEPFGGISGVLSKIGKSSEKVFTSLGKAIEKIVPVLMNFAKWIKEHKTLITVLAITIGSLVASFKLLSIISTVMNTLYAFKTAIIMVQTTAMLCGKSMSTLSTALKLLNLGFLTSPIFWVVAGIIALVAAFVLLWKKCDKFRQFWIKMWEGTKKVFSTVVNFVKKNWKTMLLALANPFAALFKLLYDNCDGFRNKVQEIIGAIKGFFVNVGQWFYNTLIAPIMNVVNGFLEFMKNVGLTLVAIITIPIDLLLHKVIIPIGAFIRVNVLDPIINFVRAAMEVIKGIINTVVLFITDKVNKIKAIAFTIYTFLKDKVFTPVSNFFTTVFNTMWTKVNNFVNKVKSAFNKIKSTASTVFNAIKDTCKTVFDTIGGIIKKPINAIVDGINKLLKKINSLEIPDWVPGVGGKHPNFNMIPKLATGTNYVPEDTLAMIHEGEAVVPKKFNPYANGINSKTIGAMNTPTPSIKIVVNNNMELDPLGQVVSKIKTFSGGAKNDYNYGQGV